MGVSVPLDEALKEKIGNYVSHSDRGVEPVFVGRGDLFHLVANAARSCADGQPAGQTVCLAGPPGIGKTAFLEELRGRGLSRGWGGPPTLAVDVDPSELHDPQILLARIADALPKPWRGGAGRRLRRMLGNLSERGGSFSLSGAGIGVGNVKKPSLFPWKELEGLLAGRPDGGVLCICVDEAQRLKPTSGERRNEVLAHLHRGAREADVPAFVLLAGHSQTPDVIEPSVSRRLAGDRLKHMRPLSRDESIQYVRGILDHCEVRGQQWKFTEWVARECGGFPHHLRSAMTALGKEILRNDSVRPCDLDAVRIAKDVTRLRVDYYQRRLARLTPALPLIRQLFERWDNAGVSRECAWIDARDALGRIDDQMMADLREEGTDTRKKLIGAMIASGLLAVIEDDDTWGCPIPSLRDYVLTGRHEVAASPPMFSPSVSP